MALLIALALAIADAKGLGEGKAPGLAGDLAALPAVMDTVATGFYDKAKALGAELARSDMMLLAGAGPHLAPAAFGAAKLKELAPIHAIAFPLEEYHHYRTQKAGDPLFLIAPDQASRQRALETAIVGKGVEGHTIALVPEGETGFWRLLRPCLASAARADRIGAAGLQRAAASLRLPRDQGARRARPRRPAARRPRCVTPELVTAGGLTVDHVISADGTVALARVGGNGAYSSVGALCWRERVGLVSVAVASYPRETLARLRDNGVARSTVSSWSMSRSRAAIGSSTTMKAIAASG